MTHNTQAAGAATLTEDQRRARAFGDYLKDCDKHAIQTDTASAFLWAWRASTATAPSAPTDAKSAAPAAAGLARDPMVIYRAACDVRDWANALGTVLESKPALIASIERLRAMVVAPATVPAAPSAQDSAAPSSVSAEPLYSRQYEGMDGVDYSAPAPAAAPQAGEPVNDFESFLLRNGDPTKLSEPLREILRQFFEAGRLSATVAKKTMPEPGWRGDVDEATYKAGWNDCVDALATPSPAVSAEPVAPSDDEQLVATLIHCARAASPEAVTGYDLSSVLNRAAERIQALAQPQQGTGSGS